MSPSTSSPPHWRGDLARRTTPRGVAAERPRLAEQHECRVQDGGRTLRRVAVRQGADRCASGSSSRPRFSSATPRSGSGARRGDAGAAGAALPRPVVRTQPVPGSRLARTPTRDAQARSPVAVARGEPVEAVGVQSDGVALRRPAQGDGELTQSVGVIGLHAAVLPAPAVPPRLGDLQKPDHLGQSLRSLSSS